MCLLCAQKSMIKAGNNKFQDLINASRILCIINVAFYVLHFNFLTLIRYRIISIVMTRTCC